MVITRWSTIPGIIQAVPVFKRFVIKAVVIVGVILIVIMTVAVGFDVLAGVFVVASGTPVFFVFSFRSLFSVAVHVTGILCSSIFIFFIEIIFVAAVIAVARIPLIILASMMISASSEVSVISVRLFVPPVYSPVSHGIIVFMVEISNEKKMPVT
jgi:hypothetical protein